MAVSLVKKMLCNTNEAARLIQKGLPLLFSGSAEDLALLPNGNWIGGSTPYLMTEKGGVETRDILQVSSLPEGAIIRSIQRYGMGGLHLLVEDSPVDGFTLVILPSSSLVHQAFAKAVPTYEGIGSKNIVGWVSGTFNESFAPRPRVYFGPIAHVIEDEIVAMHVVLPAGRKPSMQVINLYEPDEGDEIRFVTEGFTVTHALINGVARVFSDYLMETKRDHTLPLVTDYRGSRLNIDIKEPQTNSGHVTFFAPVFRNVSYRFAKPVKNIHEQIRRTIAKQPGNAIFECICIRNYEKLGMGRDEIGPFEGPVSYGEIAKFLTNLAIVRLVAE